MKKIRHTIDEAYFANIDTEEKAYWLGFIAADGCVYKNRLMFCLSAKDRAHLEKFNKTLKSDYLVKDIVFKNKSFNSIPSNGVKLDICNKKLVSDLSKVGIAPRKSLTYTSWNGPKELMRHYWRGMVDGDGSVLFKKNFLTTKRSCGIYFCGTYETVEAFRNFVNQHTGSFPKIQANRSIYRVSYTGFGLNKRICELLYLNTAIFLDRKYEKAKLIMAEGPRVVNRSSITKESIVRSYSKHKSWNKVANELNVGVKYLLELRAARGLGNFGKLPCKRKIIELTKNVVYNSIRDAEKLSGVSRFLIYKSLKHKNNIKYDLIFQYT